MTKFYETLDQNGNLVGELTTAEYAEQIMEAIQKSECLSFGKTTQGDSLTHNLNIQGEERLTISITKTLNRNGWGYQMAVIPGWMKPCTVNEYYDILAEMRDKADKYEF